MNTQNTQYYNYYIKNCNHIYLTVNYDVRLVTNPQISMIVWFYL